MNSLPQIFNSAMYNNECTQCGLRCVYVQVLVKLDYSPYPERWGVNWIEGYVFDLRFFVFRYLSTDFLTFSSGDYFQILNTLFLFQAINAEDAGVVSRCLGDPGGGLAGPDRPLHSHLPHRRHGGHGTALRRHRRTQRRGC